MLQTMRYFLAPSHCLRMCEVVQQCQSVGAAACCASAGVHGIIPLPLRVCRHQPFQKWTTGCGSCCAVFFFYYYYFRARAMDMLDSAAPLNARLPSQEKRKLSPWLFRQVYRHTAPHLFIRDSAGWSIVVSSDFALSRRCNSSQLCTVAVSVCLCCEHAQLREKR